MLRQLNYGAVVLLLPIMLCQLNYEATDLCLDPLTRDPLHSSNYAPSTELWSSRPCKSLARQVGRSSFFELCSVNWTMKHLTCKSLARQVGLRTMLRQLNYEASDLYISPLTTGVIFCILATMSRVGYLTIPSARLLVLFYSIKLQTNTLVNKWGGNQETKRFVMRGLFIEQGGHCIMQL